MRSGEEAGSTANRDYTDRLTRKSRSGWKTLFNVQAPYRWNLRRLRLGRVLDIGCGIGRNLAHLAHIGRAGVGVDHNPHSVAEARQAGWTAFTPDEFFRSPEARAGSFDTLLLAHVVEHMTTDDAVVLLSQYLGFLKPGGRVVLITPQERGFRSDATHVEFIDFAGQLRIAERVGLSVVRQYSFPFPRWVGKVFAHNEFVSVLRS